ncbi:MAG: hypothetical protein JWL76_2014 [Thermoleophilia bacterium]|nr:hypothetical protein [Thermoleophilia bacterium]
MTEHLACAPSSTEARAHGCTCLGGDTPEGNGLDSRGYPATDDDVAHWVVAATCPIHARNLPKETT